MPGESSTGLRRRLLRSLREKVAKSDELLEAFLARLREKYPRSAIVLFGSRARGDHLPYSDYDVALVLRDEDCADKVGVAEEARALKPPGLSLDLIVLCVSELDDPLVKQMLGAKKVLYDGLGVFEEKH
ncbi:nucleotidyltransferase domain-containing protein [Pyrofollis japonicus]|uniref:nucleotidyltransferase domain-containing protein n=1 Tax=Pyrofollis japonicus TaxID=3060460 RepID=UPI00295B4079|nr:nucleotidyltransferase domain-containing protein [Pyrofollis japonicus]BEP16728.1 nucleotidyltransferase domain-containing protein [Pyrofollis japonicus]